MKLITARDGAKGFDANVTITPEFARLFRQHDYDFAIRYVGRRTQAQHDITAREAQDITDAGLGLMLVQHVENPGWLPSEQLGLDYGYSAGLFASRAGYPAGGLLALDLEEVAPHVAEDLVVVYADAWYDVVSAHGYDPILYVGDGAGISSASLYSKLRFKRYWSAYNLNADAYPAVRGVQLRQHAWRNDPGDPQVPFQYDTNTAQPDKLGSRILLAVK